MNVRQLMPYLSASDAEHRPTLLSPPTPTVQSVEAPVVFDPQPGAFVLLPNEGGCAYQLLRITDRDASSASAQYLNTTEKTRLKNFRYCYYHPDKKEIQSMYAVTNKGYEKWIDEFDIADFCQSEVTVNKTPTGFQLKRSDINEVLKHTPS
jgi:hypothetical protein